MEVTCKGFNPTKNEKRLNTIIKRIFSLDNKILLINFFNAIYNDGLSESTRIELY